MNVENALEVVKSGLARDELLAQGAFPLSTEGADRWQYDGNQVRGRDPRYLVADRVGLREGAHISRHDPGRALRQAEVLRKLVAAYEDPQVAAAAQENPYKWMIETLADIWTEDPT